MKADRPMRNIRRRPYLSPSRPSRIRPAPSVSAYPPITHRRPTGVAPRDFSRAGSATLTIDARAFAFRPGRISVGALVRVPVLLRGPVTSAGGCAN